MGLKGIAVLPREVRFLVVDPVLPVGVKVTDGVLLVLDEEWDP